MGGIRGPTVLAGLLDGDCGFKEPTPMTQNGDDKPLGNKLTLGLGGIGAAMFWLGFWCFWILGLYLVCGPLP